MNEKTEDGAMSRTVGIWGIHTEKQYEVRDTGDVQADGEPHGRKDYRGELWQ